MWNNGFEHNSCGCNNKKPECCCEPCKKEEKKEEKKEFVCKCEEVKKDNCKRPSQCCNKQNNY